MSGYFFYLLCRCFYQPWAYLLDVEQLEIIRHHLAGEEVCGLWITSERVVVDLYCSVVLVKGLSRPLLWYMYMK